MINVGSRRGCKDLITILEKSDGHEWKHHLFSFEFVILNVTINTKMVPNTQVNFEQILV